MTYAFNCRTRVHLQRPLTATDGVEIGNPPSQPRQTQQALNQSQALAQCQAKQALDAQAKLDGRIRERLLATPFATGKCVHRQVFDQPAPQRPSDLECGVGLLNTSDAADATPCGCSGRLVNLQ